jgi:L-aminopeptidase/D-esterase-like protein
MPLDDSLLRAAHVGRIGSAAADCLTRAIARAAFASKHS